MTEKQVPGQLTREEAKNYILLILDRFRVMTLHLNDNRSKLPSILNENKEILDLVYELEARNFYIDLMHLYLSDIFEVLSSEGYKEFLLKCKSISEKFCLKVKIPENITVVGEDIIEQFISELTEKSLGRLRNNLEEVEDTKDLLLSQVVGININNENKNELETIISKRQEYEIAKKNHNQGNLQIQILASSHCADENAYKQYYKICEENKKIMDTILCDYPLVQYFKNKTEEAYLIRQITKTFDDINDAINKIINKIIEGKYPIWHFDSLISELLQKYSSSEAQIIKQQLEDMKKKEDFKDLFLTIGSITLSVLTLLIPGGVIAGLLHVKSGLQIANAAFSVASAINDIEDSVLYKQEVLSHIKVSPEVQELMNTENISLTDAQIQLLVVLLSGTFVIFDLNDAKKSVDLLRKLDNLDNEAVQALKQSKHFGEKAFQNVDTITLNHIGKVEKATKVFDNLSTLDVKQIPEALNFFPNNLNTNVIWLGMDNVDAKSVLTCSDNVCKKYNAVADEINTALDFSKPSKELEEEVNNIAVSLIRNKKLDLSPSEHVTLLKESLPPADKLTSRKLYLRVQPNNDWKTLASPNKSFAWMTDPLMIAGDGLPRDLTNSVGFLKKDVDSLSDCCYFDLVVFKDAKTAEKYIPNKITGWDRICEDFFNGMDEEIAKITDPIELEKYKDIFPNLVTDFNTFNRDYFNKNYLDYFMNQHIPGTDYELGVKADLGEKIEKITGANKLYQGAGITVQEDGGIRCIERAFDKSIDGTDYNFSIDNLQDTRDMKIYRFEITSDTSKPIKIVEAGAKK